MQRRQLRYLLGLTSASLWLCLVVSTSYGADLAHIKQRGTLLHLGVPYANFVTGSGDGLDVELMQLFARHLGLVYQYVSTSWDDVISDLTGEKTVIQGDTVQAFGAVPVKGDVIANGFTVLPNREKLVDYSTPTFPTQVWLVARGDSTIRPITPTGSVANDIAMVRELLKDREVLGIVNTCLDPELYDLRATGAKVRCFPGSLNELAPAIINGEAETTILDVPDAMIALEKWPGKIKIVGPISPVQLMGCAFAKTSGELRDAFNRFFEQCKRDGTYMRLVTKYYPRATHYFPEFFVDCRIAP